MPKVTTVQDAIMSQCNTAAATDLEELIDAQKLVHYHANSFVGPMSIKCAVELHIPDTVSRLYTTSNGAPVSLSVLAAGLPLLHPSKARFLPRLMRLLVQLGVFAVAPSSSPEPAYLPTPFSSLLISDRTANGSNRPRGSMASYFCDSLQPGAISPWFHLGEWFQAGECGPATAFEAAHGMSIWEYMSSKPEEAQRFNDRMSSDTELAMELLVRRCADVFHGVGSLVDVGGGTGAAARVMKEAFPAMRCTVLELPNVVLEARAKGRQGGGVEFVAGNMFETIPQADAVFLKCVLHDWDDDNCLKILKKCKEAIPAINGKVLLFDVVMGSYKTGDQKLVDSQLFSDLAMITTCASTERDEEEWCKLFTSAGFRKLEVKHALGLRSLMVAYP